MKEKTNRREFTWLASSGVCGVFAGPLLRAADPESEAKLDPAKKGLVLPGLNALARAHEMDYFADGHRGASLISA